MFTSLKDCAAWGEKQMQVYKNQRKTESCATLRNTTRQLYQRKTEATNLEIQNQMQQRRDTTRGKKDQGQVLFNV